MTTALPRFFNPRPTAVAAQRHRSALQRRWRHGSTPTPAARSRTEPPGSSPSTAQQQPPAVALLPAHQDSYLVEQEIVPATVVVDGHHASMAINGVPNPSLVQTQQQVRVPVGYAGGPLLGPPPRGAAAAQQRCCCRRWRCLTKKLFLCSMAWFCLLVA